MGLLVATGLRPRPRMSPELETATSTPSAPLRPADKSGGQYFARVTGIVTPPTNQSQIIAERMAELQALAMNEDASSLNEIMSELTHPEPQLRQAALEAVIQFGSQSAIPRLRELAEQSEDATEKADLLAAIEFLNLPSLMDLQPAARRGSVAGVSAGTNRLGTSPFPSRRTVRP